VAGIDADNGSVYAAASSLEAKDPTFSSEEAKMGQKIKPKMVDKHVLFPEDLWNSAERVALLKTLRSTGEKHTASDVIREGTKARIAELERELAAAGEGARRRSTDHHPRKAAVG
jgi:hypothetical protein